MLLFCWSLKEYTQAFWFEVIVVVWWMSAWLGLALQTGLGILLRCGLKTRIGYLLYISGTTCCQKGRVTIF